MLRDGDEGLDLVEQLPDMGAVVVVRRNDVGRALRSAIVDRRGQALADRCRILTISDRGDTYQLLGLRGPVVLERSFTTSAPPGLLGEVSEIAAQIRATRPPPPPR